MSAHARLSASAAHRWMSCPGSVVESERVPNLSSSYAVEGTFAHSIAGACLMDSGSPSRWLDAKHTEDGHTVVCDQEMVDGVQFYLDDCYADVQSGDRCWNEVRLDALQRLDKDFGGTADRIRYRPSTKHLLVTDLKYGAGIVVEPENNKQLQIYALGALLETREPVEDVTVRIVQPRIEHEDERVRDWTFRAIDLLDFTADILEAAEKTRVPNPVLIPGPWCKTTFCPARHVCPELEKAQHALVAVEFQAAVKYDPAKLSASLDLIPMVEARIKALREFAYAEAERGNVVPGYKLVDKRAMRSWTDEAKVIAWAKAKAVEPYAPAEIKSPAQLEKGLKKPEKEELKQFIESKSSGRTLVPATDDRSEAKRLTAGDFATPSAVSKLF